MISQGIVIATQSHLYRVTSGYHIEIALLGFQGSHLWVKLVEFTKWQKKKNIPPLVISQKEQTDEKQLPKRWNGVSKIVLP
jgi:hypothetical protein